MSEKTNLRNMVYKGIQKDILTGKYSIDSIINERELIEKYGISKSPIRDALIELCNDGILVSIPRYGYKIVYYSKEYYQNIVDFRLLVEPAQLEKYWDRLTDDDILELEKLHIEGTRNQDRDNIELYWKSNSEFHLKLASFYHDEFFYETLKKALNKQMVAFAQFYWGHWDRSIFSLYTEQHEDMIQFLKDRNKEKAIEELKIDIISFIKM